MTLVLNTLHFIEISNDMKFVCCDLKHGYFVDQGHRDISLWTKASIVVDICRAIDFDKSYQHCNLAGLDNSRL